MLVGHADGRSDDYDYDGDDDACDGDPEGSPGESVRLSAVTQMGAVPPRHCENECDESEDKPAAPHDEACEQNESCE